MSTTNAATRLRRIIKLAIGFAISLAVGKAVEVITHADTINAFYQVQKDWIAAVEQMSPLNLVDVFIKQLGVSKAGWATPALALWNTMQSYFDAGAFAGLMQIGLGALAVAALNMTLSRSGSIWFGIPGNDGRVISNIIFGPPAVIAAGSGLALVLQFIMLGALAAFQWITGLAALAAGATGLVGFVWYCLIKLGEKGAEHVLTPKV